MKDKKRIMIVEDEGITAMKIRNVLVSMGHAVTSIEVSGAAAVESALAEMPDLILMDIMLSGGMDGIEAAERIRSRTDVPVVFLTAYSDNKTVEKVWGTEPFGYIIKPFDEQELRMVVEIALFKDSMERQLKRHNRLLLSIIDSLTHPFYVINVDDYTIRFANMSARRQGVLEKTTCYAHAHNRNSPCSDAEHPCIITRILESRENAVLEHIHYDSEGNPRTIEVHGYPIFDSRGNIVQVIEYNLDVTDRRKMEKRLADAAITDDLTGLFNRRGFFTLGEQQCRLADRHARMMTLIYMDLDGFKTINDELGHSVGDEALIETADVLRNTFRKSDIIARIGGDEFAVLLTEPTGPTAGEVVTGHIMERFRLHNEQGGRKYELLISMGVAHYDHRHPSSIDQLLRRADELMYEEKRRHRFDHRVNPLMKKRTPERRVHKRVRMGDHCWAELDISGMVKVLDLGMGGARVSASSPLSPDIIYKMIIALPDGRKTTLAGVLVWTAPRESFAYMEGPFAFEGGIRFIDLEKTQKISLDYLTSSF